MGHFGPKFELYGSKVKNDPKNGFLDPKTILIHGSHIGNNVLSVIPLDFVIFQKMPKFKMAAILESIFQRILPHLKCPPKFF